MRKEFTVALSGDSIIRRISVCREESFSSFRASMDIGMGKQQDAKTGQKA